MSGARLSSDNRLTPRAAPQAVQTVTLTPRERSARGRQRADSAVTFHPLVLTHAGLTYIVEYAFRTVQIDTRRERWFMLRDVPQWGASYVHNLMLRNDAVRQIALRHDSPHGNPAWRLFIARPFYGVERWLAEEIDMTGDLVRRHRAPADGPGSFGWLRWLRPSRSTSQRDNELVDRLCASRPLGVPDALAITLGRYFQIANLVGIEGAARYAQLLPRVPEEYETEATCASPRC